MIRLIVAASVALSFAVAANAATKQVRCVSSVTGKYVSEHYALKHRDITVCKDRSYKRQGEKH